MSLNAKELLIISKIELDGFVTYGGKCIKDVGDIGKLKLLGFDIEDEIQIQHCEHVLSTGKRHTGLRYVGFERQDDDWKKLKALLRVQ